MSHPDGGAPPNDEAAERAVIGACLGSRRALAVAVEQLAADDFYAPRHGEIFTAMRQVDERGEAVDPVTVLAQLAKRGAASRCGGGNYLHSLYADVPTAANIAHYAQLVSDTAVRRRLAVASVRVGQLATADGTDLAEALELARAAVDEVATAHRGRDGTDGADIGQLVAEALERYREPVAPVTPTGWPDLDSMLEGGLRPGTLTAIGARPNAGKSMIALNVSVHVARGGKGVLFASLEMERSEVTDRALASMAQVELSRLLRHDLRDDDWGRLRAAEQRLRDVPLRVEDTPHLTLTRLRSLARDRTRHPAGLGLVVADYMQLMTPADSRIPREQQVAAVSRGLKLLAKELHVPVIAVAQLNRGPELRSDKRPTVADLRESGSIENDSDVVILLHETADDAQLGEVTVLVGKNRHGRKGEVKLQWAPHYASARSLSRHLEAM